MFKHILVATDGSEHADKAVSLALRIAGSAKVTALAVVPDYGMAEFAQVTFTHGPDVDQLRKNLAAEGRRKLDGVLARHSGLAEAVERLVLVNDYPHRAILDTAERSHCDLIVMGSRGRGAMTSMLL